MRKDVKLTGELSNATDTAAAKRPITKPGKAQTGSQSISKLPK
ncbi:hypothetical protein [Dyadobacter crusticola]|nr:hypothetical protein [Dyadobacter crusticola]